MNSEHHPTNDHRNQLQLSSTELYRHVSLIVCFCIIFVALTGFDACKDSVILDPKLRAEGASSSSSSSSSTDFFGSDSSGTSSFSSLSSDSSSSSSSSLSTSSEETSSSASSLFTTGTFAGSAVESPDDEEDVAEDSFDDTDQDGLPNSAEEAFSTDPTNPDSDGDGFTDSFEVAYGFSPTDAYNHPSSRLIPRKTLARSTEVPSKAEPSTDDKQLIPGGTRDPYLDSDGDGRADGLEELNNTNPASAEEVIGDDSDSDGLLDDVELYLGTSPLKSDTDHDQLSDPDEILQGLDARDPDTDHDGIIDGFHAPKTFDFNL